MVISKTQLALKLAQMSSAELSVIWVRADNWEHFVGDYSPILRRVYSHQEVVPAKQLIEDTKERLEAHAAEWLLVLDNADDYDEFINRIMKHIPKKGKILITTRDRRLQGTITGGQNGFYLDPMNPAEANVLLEKSIPSNLYSASSSSAGEITQILGNLPLAIAQAAANIVEQHMPLQKLSELLQKSSTPVPLLNHPFRDHMTSDERNGFQSVSTTWDMSLKRLQQSSPMAVTLLGYLSCFHSSAVPYSYLRDLPEFRDQEELEFMATVGKIHQLCLAERTQSDVDYSAQMHPLLQEITFSSLCGSDRVRWISPLIGVLSRVLPTALITQDEGRGFGNLLVPHAKRLIALGLDCGIISEKFYHLISACAGYLATFEQVDAAMAAALQSLNMAVEIWGDQCLETFTAREIKMHILATALRFDEAIKEGEIAISYLESDMCSLELSEYQLLDRTEQLYNAMVVYSTMRLPWFDRSIYLRKLLNTYETAEAHLEDEGNGIDPCHYDNLLLFAGGVAGLRMKKLEAESYLSLSFGKDEGVTITEAFAINRRVLDSINRIRDSPWEHQDIDVDIFDLHISALKIRANLLRETQGDQREIHEIYREIYSTSWRYPITDLQIWNATLDLIQSVWIMGDENSQTPIWDEVLGAATNPGVILPVSANTSIFLQELSLVHRLALCWIEYLCHFGRMDEVHAMQRKLEHIECVFARGIPFLENQDRSAIGKATLAYCLNLRGERQMQCGQFLEAEKKDRFAIEVLGPKML
jgi:hypothetical protein